MLISLIQIPEKRQIVTCLPDEILTAIMEVFNLHKTSYYSMLTSQQRLLALMTLHALFAYANASMLSGFDPYMDMYP